MRLGILIPYYNNHPECENRFKKLMKTLEKQLFLAYNVSWFDCLDVGQEQSNIELTVFEDGQYSEWLYKYVRDNIYVISSLKNDGVAITRNCLLLSASDDYDYIMFLDSDDMIDCDFIRKMYEMAGTNEYDMIISKFIMNKKEIIYNKRSNVAGICLRTEFIKGLSFNVEYNISEDALFIEEVYKRNPRIGKIDSNYYYNYGANPNSLMMRFERSELNLMKE